MRTADFNNTGRQAYHLVNGSGYDRFFSTVLARNRRFRGINVQTIAIRQAAPSLLRPR